MAEYISSQIMITFSGSILVIAAVIAISESVRRLCVYGVHRKAIIFLLLGIAGFVSFSTINFVKYRMVSEASTTLSQAHKRSIAILSPDNWRKDLTAEHRESLGRMYAEEVFLDSGALILHSDRLGNAQIFAPTQAEIETRVFQVVGQTQLDALAKERKSDIFYSILFGIFAAIFGFLSSLLKNDKAHTVTQ